MIRRKRNRAVALVVVLSVVVILTLIVVSLTVAMRMERQAAFFFSERSRADFMAREGVEMAKIILSDSLGDTNNFVVTMPGQLMIVTNRTTGDWTSVSLASGPVPTTSISGVLAPPDLNKTNKTGDGRRQIDPVGGPMVLPWIYVLQNGDRTNAPTADTNNPVIGRYAFWVDDESSRVNFNTAWKSRNAPGSPFNTNGYAHSSQVSLSGLSTNITPTLADDIYNGTKVRPLQSLAEAERLSSGLSDSLSSNRFFASHYNHSSDLNPWGEPKIVLTTKSNRANGRPFLDILTNQTVDPGGRVETVVDFAKLNTQMTNLVALLSRTNWPLFPGKSFSQKYKPSNTNRIAQLALDIIEYVRSAESTNQAVPMIRTIWNGSSYAVGNTALNTFLGTSRHPLLTEIGLWVSDTTNSSGYFEGQVKAELYLPPNYGLDSFNLVGNRIGVSLAAISDPAIPMAGASGTVYTNTISATDAPDQLVRGGYTTVTTPVFVMKEVNTNSLGIHEPIGTNGMQIRVYFATSQNAIWEQANGISSPIPYTLAGVPRPGVNDPLLRTLQVDDPRINKTRLDWSMTSSGNTLGRENAIWKKSASSASPQQDMEGTNSFSDYSLFMAAPGAGVSSVAELGRVSTGVEVLTNSGVPWRTVRLQPTSTNDATIPDWALLELFAAPVSTNNTSIYFPQTNSVAGRVNVNARIEPFGTNSKTVQLTALFSGLTNMNVPDVVDRVKSHTLTANGRSWGSTNMYKYPGEIVEIEGMADGGEGTERNLISFIDLAATRSGVFRVFAVGQSIQQTSKGDLIINATKSVESVMEFTGGSGGQIRSVTWKENPL